MFLTWHKGRRGLHPSMAIIGLVVWTMGRTSAVIEG